MKANYEAHGSVFELAKFLKTWESERDLNCVMFF